MNESRSRSGPVAWALAALTVVPAFTSSTPTRSETIRGNVHTPGGTPAQGAKVWTAKLWNNFLERKETVTDDQGRFHFELSPGDWWVWANVGTRAGDTSRGVTIQPGKQAEPISIRLAEWGRLRGRLVEAESGKPIPLGEFVLDNGLIPVTDDQGRFDAVALSPVGYHEAFVVCPGRARMRVLFVMRDKPVTELEVRVPRAGKIVGRVTDEQGHPVPGAHVGRSTSGRAISTKALFIRCDDQGHFVYDGVTFDRPTRLSAGAEGYEGQEKNDLLVDAKSGSLALDFRLARAPDAPSTAGALPPRARDSAAAEFRDVTGTVFGPADRRVAGAAVRWGANEHSETLHTRSDTDGRFRLQRVPAENGVVAVIAAAAKLAPAFAFVGGRGDQDVRVSLVPGRSARGVVRDDRGVPFAGVSVTPVIFSPDPDRGGMVWLEELAGETDANGRFALYGLPVAGVKFDFLRQGLSDLRSQILELDGPENVVTMQAGGAIQGRVVDAGGRPVRSFRVLLNASHARRPGDKFGGFFAGFCGIGLTYTSDDGSFVVKDLVAGSVQRLSVMAPGHGEGALDRAIAEPENHLSPAEALTIRLPLPHALRVRAVDAASGQPVADARVALIYDDPGIDTNFAWGYHDVAWGDEVRTRTGPDGWADFPPLSFGEATLLVQAPGYYRRHLGWRDGAPKVEVALKREAVVAGEVLSKETGKPLDGVYVRLLSKQGEQISGSIDRPDQGHFYLSQLPEGAYTLSVSVSFGGELHQEEVALEAGKKLTLSLRLSKSETKGGMMGMAIPKVKRTAEPKRQLKIGDSAPDFSAKTLDGKALALKNYRGKYVGPAQK